MPQKIDPDSTAGVKVLRMFRKLLAESKRHFQSDLAKELECSPQTIIRLAREIEVVVGDCLETGLENRRRWYQLKTVPRSSPGLSEGRGENPVVLRILE